MKLLAVSLILALLGACATDGDQQELEQQEIEQQQEDQNQNQQQEQNDQDEENQEEDFNDEDEDNISEFEEDESALQGEDNFGFEDDGQQLSQEPFSQQQTNDSEFVNETQQNDMFENEPQDIGEQINSALEQDTQEDFPSQDMEQQQQEPMQDMQQNDMFAQNQNLENQQMMQQQENPVVENTQDQAVQQAPEPVVQQTPVNEIVPTFHRLSWIGHEFDPTNKLVQIELMTSGTPEFEVFQEKNQATQPELVIRFFQTSLRPKLKWDIDSSEFRSPIAYIRPRVLKESGIVDVIITLRDGVKPKFFSKDSNIKLTFPIPEYYFGNLAQANIQAIRGQRMADSTIGLVLDEQSELPKNVGQVDSNDIEPVGEPIEGVMTEEQNVDENGFPDNFNNNTSSTPCCDGELYVVQSFSLFNVGQDNLEEDEQQEQENQNENENEEENQQQEQDQENENVNENEEENQQENFQQQQDIEQVNQENAGLGEPLNENVSQNFNPANVQIQEQGFEDNMFSNEPAPQNQMQQGQNMQGQGQMMQDNFENGNMALQGQDNLNMQELPSQTQENVTNLMDQQMLDNMNQEAIVDNVQNIDRVPPDMEPEGSMSNMRQGQRYIGKLIYMEFTDAPLSIIFKSFPLKLEITLSFPKRLATSRYPFTSRVFLGMKPYGPF